ncbi:N-acetyltransferase [Ideonella sp. B7]|uniref:GNAT family N-acetyltransferase n=1 Tax=Ideonella benzenivorans TaxID=2831643 RepID=UPI001CEC6166|nr:GNAT family N-acetyltransferase [Ideonella benzenivorans]MCA6217752.1 N-acetyltransferase [Ideonella benzenivorans]
MSDTTEPTIVHNVAASRFETKVSNLLCVASYHLHNGVMDMLHTGVPPALEGRGIAAKLVAAALAHARAQGLKVRPSCSYVAVYMRRHPETADLLAP